jgi:hypothetical protein
MGWSEHPSSFEGGTTSLQFTVLDQADERRPVKELYGVFRRPRNDEDRRVGEIAARWGALDFGFGDFPDFQPPRPAGISDGAWKRAQLGKVIESEGRLLLAGLGGSADMLYAAPTDNDCIAHAFLPNGGGGCGAPGPDGLDVGWFQSESGELVVAGLVGDTVEAVDLVVGGETLHTRMGENAFGLRLERAHEDSLERLVLHRRDGTTNEIPLRPEPEPK